MDIPGGSEPAETQHVNGGIPPSMLRTAPPAAVPFPELYAWPCVAGGTFPGMETVSGPGALTVRDKEAGALACAVVESVTVIVKFEDPAAVGVPEITPLGESVNPAGREPVVRLQL